MFEICFALTHKSVLFPRVGDGDLKNFFGFLFCHSSSLYVENNQKKCYLISRTSSATLGFHHPFNIHLFNIWLTLHNVDYHLTFIVICNAIFRYVIVTILSDAEKSKNNNVKTR